MVISGASVTNMAARTVIYVIRVAKIAHLLLGSRPYGKTWQSSCTGYSSINSCMTPHAKNRRLVQGASSRKYARDQPIKARTAGRVSRSRMTSQPASAGSKQRFWASAQSTNLSLRQTASTAANFFASRKEDESRYAANTQRLRPGWIRLDVHRLNFKSFIA